MPSPKTVNLSVFINEHMEAILQEWESFARSIMPSPSAIDKKTLRDHALQMLMTIVADMETLQTSTERAEKSKGHALQNDMDTPAETHAIERVRLGFSIVQLVAEYRALRASVLRLWAMESKKGSYTEPDEITRFNEAIDQALTESVARYHKLVFP